jgi:hypothetical protein
LFVALLVAITAHAQQPPTCTAVPCSEVHTVAAPDQGVPLEFTFTVSLAGTFQITLTDLGAQALIAAPLASVKLAITSGSTVVGMPLAAAGSAQFDATPGTYAVHIIGQPGPKPGSGPVGVQIKNTADSSVVASFSGTLAPSSIVPSNETVVDDDLSIPSDDNYTVTLTDLSLPGPLGTALVAIVQPGGNIIYPAPGSPGPVAIAKGTYSLFAVGQTATGTPGGLYSIVVSGAQAGVVYNRTLAVGAVQLLGSPTLTADNYSLSATDLALPNALTQLAAMVTLNGQSVATLAAAGQQAFPGTANTYQVFAVGTAGASGAASYAVRVQSQTAGTAPALTIARAVSTPGGATTAYSFDANIASAGTYSLDLADFSFPAQFTSLSAAAVQNGALLGTPLNRAASMNVTPAAGPISLLVFANAATGGGLFGIDLATAGASPVFDTTQGVGQLFSVRRLSITAPGSYSVTVSDVNFPSPLATFSVVVTQGATLIGSIYGGGTFAFPATAGNYALNFIAQPGGTDKAGTYAIGVAPTPAAPAVMLQSDAASVTPGSTVHLIWSTTAATACTASGGWSGSQPTSGTATSAPLNSATTFTLSCTGAGGTSSQSVTVAISTPSKGGGGGGGGALDPALLGLLGLVLAGVVVRALGSRMTRDQRKLRNTAVTPDIYSAMPRRFHPDNPRASLT